MIKGLENRNVYTKILDGEVLLNGEFELSCQIDFALSFSTAVSKTLLSDFDMLQHTLSFGLPCQSKANKYCPDLGVGLQ